MYDVDGLDCNDNIPKLQTIMTRKTIAFGVTHTYTGHIKVTPYGIEASFTNIKIVGKRTYAATT